MISAGAIENCGNIGILQLPHNHDFKTVKTFLEADNLCKESDLQLPGEEMKKCMSTLQTKMMHRIGYKKEPPVWFDVDVDFPVKTQTRHVVCSVRKFNQAMLWWECVHGKPIDPVWHDGSVYVTLHIILTVFYQQFLNNLDLIQSHYDRLDT